MHPTRSKKIILSAIIIASTLGGANTFAQEPPENSGKWSIGAGAALFTSPFKGADDIFTPLPYLSYEGKKLSASNLGISYKIIDDNDFSVSVIVAPRFQLVEPKDSRFLTGMAKRKATLELGFALDYKSDLGIFSLVAQTDALSAHKGSEVSLTYSLPLEVGRFNLKPSFSIIWQDTKLADYYYGVRAIEAIAIIRPKYVVDDIIIPSYGMDFNYKLTEKIDLVGITSVSILPDEVTKNKIIDEDYNASAIVGLIYKF